LIGCIAFSDRAEADFHTFLFQKNSGIEAIQADMLVAHALDRTTDQIFRRKLRHAAIKDPDPVQGSDANIKSPSGKLRIADRSTCQVKNLPIHFDRRNTGILVDLQSVYATAIPKSGFRSAPSRPKAFGNRPPPRPHYPPRRQS